MQFDNFPFFVNRRDVFKSHSQDGTEMQLLFLCECMSNIVYFTYRGNVEF